MSLHPPSHEVGPLSCWVGPPPPQEPPVLAAGLRFPVLCGRALHTEPVFLRLRLPCLQHGQESRGRASGFNPGCVTLGPQGFSFQMWDDEIRMYWRRCWED